jgi:hypothetical protein
VWTAVSNGEAVARFHQPCHAEWLAQQEVAAAGQWGSTGANAHEAHRRLGREIVST